MSITREEILEKYGNIQVEFSHYYKYTFTFVGELENGEEVYVDVGGNSENIYKEEVSDGQMYYISELDFIGFRTVGVDFYDY